MESYRHSPCMTFCNRWEGTNISFIILISSSYLFLSLRISLFLFKFSDQTLWIFNFLKVPVQFIFLDLVTLRVLVRNTKSQVTFKRMPILFSSNDSCCVWEYKTELLSQQLYLIQYATELHKPYLCISHAKHNLWPSDFCWLRTTHINYYIWYIMIPEHLRTGFSTCNLKTNCGPLQSVGSPSGTYDLIHISKYMGNKHLGKSEKRITYFYISGLFKQCIRCNTIHSFIHLVVCLRTGPKHLPKRALHIVRSRASSFKW